MSGKYWKLAITSLSPGSTSAREAVVEGENWLSALRAARKVLGEDGAVPPGASCVMSSTGEVTILDAAQRLRYMLTRAEAPAEPVMSTLPPPTVKLPSAKRATTLAYSPEEAAAARAQLNAATQPAPATPASSPAPAPSAASDEAKPAFAPARPLSRPPPEKKAEPPKVDPRRPIPPKRSATVAYSPEESAQLRRDLEAAKVASDASPPHPAPAAPSDAPAPSKESAAPRESAAPVPQPQATPAAAVQPAVATPPPALAPAGTPASSNAVPASAGVPTQGPAAAALAQTLPAPSVAAATRPARRQTIAYSPEESARARAQLTAAQLKSASTTTSLASSSQDHLVESEVPSMLVMLGQRDEETSKESPLTYRERSYYWPPPAQRSEVERALRGELSNLRKALSTRARGQYVNLAVFDHAFGEKPERPPIATLQWKDWRGDPVFAWLDEPASASWSPAEPGPVTSSYFPDPASVPSVPAPTPAASPASAPLAATPTPMRAPSRRESTGEQDLRLTVAFEAVQDLYFLATPADGLDFAVKLLSELVPAEAISGCIYDINTDEFRFVALTGPGATERRADAVRSNQGLFGVAAHGGRDSLIVPDVMNEPRYDPVVDGRHEFVARNMAFFVLHKADQLFGMLQLINRDGGKTFREADIAVASYIANQVTAFLREKRGLTRSHG